MKYFPPPRSWMNSLIFIFSTSLMLFAVRFLLNITDFFTHILKIENQHIFIALAIVLFILIPILVYGYTHYIMFGQPEHPQIPWLISGDSVIEGIWMFITFILCLIFTFLILIGLDSPLLWGVETLKRHQLENSITQAETHLFWIGLFWFIATAYFYYIRTITHQFIRKIITRVISIRKH